MIFAHAPLGYLTAYVTRQRRPIQLAVAALGGIFPDIDLFYYYLFDASLNHRQFLTHSALPYLSIMVLGVAFVKMRSQRVKYIGIILVAFAVGACSHLLADSLTGRLVWLFPLSTTLYGLSSIAWYVNSAWFSYGLTINYTAELLVFILTGYTVLKKKLWYIIVSSMIVVPVVMGLLWLDEHTYKTDSVFAYNDNDGDGLMNAQDSDMDGDDIMNSLDQPGDITAELSKMIGSYYDFTNGSFIQIPLRIGFVNDHILIERMYTNIGISFAPELAADYEHNSSGYASTPKDYRFVSNVRNWQTWLQHTQRWTSATTLLTANPYDIIFFQSGHVALYYPEIDGASVIDVSPAEPFTRIVSLAEVAAREGDVVGVGKVLPD